MYATIAHVQEQRRHLLAAQNAFAAWAHIAPDAPGPKQGLARFAHAAGQWEETGALCQSAREALRDQTAPATRHLDVFQASSLGKGLGDCGALDPDLDMTSLQLHALLQDNDSETACKEVEAMPASQRRAILTAFYPHVDAPGSEALLKALMPATAQDTA